MQHATRNMQHSFEQTIQRLRHRLTQPLPGREVYMRMAPENPMHRIVEVARESGCREGAVLLLLYLLDGEIHTVLTRRSDSLSNHAGQISLPGGRLDPGESVTEAAVREAWEELGVVPEELDILGHLSELYIPPSNYCLTPVIAATHRRPDFEPHDAEVAELIETPVRRFTDPANRHEETRFIAGKQRSAPYYRIGPHKVWGATAMILTEMAALWNELMNDDEEKW
ncbi:MAG: CoA pyrophosphatase [Chloroflexota bacterium]|nr:CoA pyrophosphatase [Chloroflexota bacterium]